MANSHYKSNIVGFDGSQSISNFSSVTADSLVGPVTGNVTASIVTADSYIRLGTKKFLLFGDYVTEASIVSVATALSASPGSVYFGAGDVWIMTDSNSAATIPV